MNELIKEIYGYASPFSIVREIRPRHRKVTSKTITFVTIVALFQSGRALPQESLFSKLLGSNMKEVATKVYELAESNSDALVFGLAFSPDGNHLAVDVEGPSINIWDLRKKTREKALQKLKGGNDFDVPNPIFYSPDGRLLVNCLQFTGGSAALRIWNTVSGEVLKDIREDSGSVSRGACTGAAFTPNGKLLVRTADTRGKPGNNLIAFDTGDFEPVWGFSIDPMFNPRSIAISPNGEMMAMTGSVSKWHDGSSTSLISVQLVSVSLQKIVKEIPTSRGGVIAWSPDGKRIAITGGGIGILDPVSGKDLGQESIQNAGHMNIRFTADGRYFVQSDYNALGNGLGAKIWDGQRKSLLQEIPGNITSIAVSKDNRYLAIGEVGRTTIWQFK